jgi:hypothetical protein
VQTNEIRGANAMYKVFKQLENGEFEYVASRNELSQAVKFMESLKALWPGEYEVRDCNTESAKYLKPAGQEGKAEIYV